MSIFKKGDKVFDIRFGWGEVIDDYGYDFPILVQFEGVEEKYTLEGRLFEGEIAMLSFKEYSLEGFSQERPLPDLNKGDLVYVKTCCGQWHWIMRFFSHYGDDGRAYVFTRQEKEGITMPVEEFSIENPFKEYEVK